MLMRFPARNPDIFAIVARTAAWPVIFVPYYPCFYARAHPKANINLLRTTGRALFPASQSQAPSATS
jgi:hypothetical protein